MRAVSAPYRSYVLISRDQIARNFRNVSTVVGPDVEVAAVVKADAYGHGALEVSRVVTAEGARWLAVSSVDEGVRCARGGIQARILVMGGFLPYEAEALVEHGLTPAVHSLEQMRATGRAGARPGKPRPLSPEDRFRHGPAGHARLGRGDPARSGAGAARAARRPDDPLRFRGRLHQAADRRATGLFPRHRGRLRAAGRPAPLSAYFEHHCHGLWPPRGWHEMVRAGHALYGYVSPARGDAPPQLLDVKPALTWKAKLMAVKDLPEGALVGYGGTFRTPRPMRIGVLGAGYADGIFHRLSNRGKVIADGQITPILGTISMDLTTIDLSHTTSLEPGDDVTLLGTEGDARLEAPEIARVAGTISYNILCSISSRVKRVYV